MTAAGRGDVAQIKALAIGPLQTFQSDSNGYSPLSAAVTSGRMDAVEALLDRYGRVSEAAIDSALSAAIHANNLSAFRRLGALSTDLLCRQTDMAAHEGRSEMLRVAAHAGCRPPPE